MRSNVFKRVRGVVLVLLRRVKGPLQQRVAQKLWSHFYSTLLTASKRTRDHIANYDLSLTNAVVPRVRCLFVRSLSLSAITRLSPKPDHMRGW